MKSDSQIQKDVMAQLKWEPLLNASEIGVSVKNGIVTLSGQVNSYSKKILAETATKKVFGVRAIAEDIQVGISPEYSKTDAEIADAVLRSLQWNTMLPEEKIKVKVEDGNVKLEGEVDWEYQRKQAISSVGNLAGVRSVINLITVKPRVTSSDIQHKIKDAFLRSATIDSDKIAAEISGSKVILRGQVRSFAEKDDAESAAYSAQGITNVENKLEIEVPEYEYEE